MTVPFNHNCLCSARLTGMQSSASQSVSHPLMCAVSAPVAGNDAGLVLQECNQEALRHAAGEPSHCSEECSLKRECTGEHTATFCKSCLHSHARLPNGCAQAILPPLCHALHGMHHRHSTREDSFEQKSRPSGLILSALTLRAVNFHAVGYGREAVGSFAADTGGARADA